MANVMITDDSPMIRRSLHGILEELGRRIVAEAEDGREAIRLYRLRSGVCRTRKEARR